MYQKYKKQIKDRPKWKFASCGRMWFKRSVIVKSEIPKSSLFYEELKFPTIPEEIKI